MHPSTRLTASFALFISLCLLLFSTHVSANEVIEESMAFTMGDACTVTAEEAYETAPIVLEATLRRFSSNPHEGDFGIYEITQVIKNDTQAALEEFYTFPSTSNPDHPSFPYVTLGSKKIFFLDFTKEDGLATCLVFVDHSVLDGKL